MFTKPQIKCSLFRHFKLMQTESVRNFPSHRISLWDVFNKEAVIKYLLLVVLSAKCLLPELGMRCYLFLYPDVKQCLSI